MTLDTRADDVSEPLYKGVGFIEAGVILVLSHLRSGLSTHLGSLSFKGQGTFATQR